MSITLDLARIISEFKQAPSGTELHFLLDNSPYVLKLVNEICESLAERNLIDRVRTWPDSNTCIVKRK